MGIVISGIEPGSIAERLGVLPGQRLLTIDGHPIEDILDYRFYLTASAITVAFEGEDGPYRHHIQKEESADIGLLFDTYLMDEQRRCKNRCIFCFIDQLPGGMRESLYFKDDDTRMSFLFGNYVTLTNLRERDIERIIAMHISPVNISVHTTNPGLRVQMMGNPHAGAALRWIPRLAQAGIRLNTQLVLCPGVNDGPYLEESLRDLLAHAPMMQSVAVVPVGLTDHRQGLSALRPFAKEEATAVLDTLHAWGDQTEALHGERICYASDEFYLLAERALPPARFYGAFDQLENGVGLWSLLKDEFLDALEDIPAHPVRRSVILATGLAALPLLEDLTSRAATRYPGLRVEVIGVRNDFFGHGITVAGLITGGDLIAQLAGKSADALLIPAVMLRHDRDLFLDDISLPDVEKATGMPVIPVENSGEALLEAILGESSREIVN